VCGMSWGTEQERALNLATCKILIVSLRSFEEFDNRKRVI
jgi:hypothetical protein